MNSADLADIVRNIIGVGPVAQGDEGHPNGNTAPWVLTSGGFTPPGDPPGRYRAFSVVPLRQGFAAPFTTRPYTATYGATFGVPKGCAVVMTPLTAEGEDGATMEARQWATTCAGVS